MSKAAKRNVVLTALTALLMAPALAAAPPKPAGHPGTRPNFITCQPGYVYRCNKYGCFCVKQ